jgi:hypothetical protein
MKRERSKIEMPARSAKVAQVWRGVAEIARPADRVDAVGDLVGDALVAERSRRLREQPAQLLDRRRAA